MNASRFSGLAVAWALIVFSSVVQSVHGSHIFTVPHTDGADDSVALREALATGQYSANAMILFARGVHYSVFTPIKFPVLNNVEVWIEGNLSYPSDIATIQGTSPPLLLDSETHVAMGIS